MAGVTYDKGAMSKARRDLESLRLGAYVPRLSQLVAMGGVKLTMDCFRKQQDPYGRKWQPLARERTRDRAARLRVLAKGKKARGQKILIDTSRMRNSTTSIQVGRSGGVAIPTGYAITHQNGAHIAPHSRLASYKNATYRVGNRFASESQARKAHMAGKSIRVDRFRRTYGEGFNIPQRMMLPSAEMGMPATWNKMIGREAKGLMQRWVQKGARQ
jgi:hypothetical protein